MRRLEMRCIVHIGAPKTGSTAIQRLLHDNRDALLERGILYPNVSLRGFGHHDFAFLLGGGYPAWATPQNRPLSELAADLRNAVASCKAETLLISSEDFFIFPEPDKLKALLTEVGVVGPTRIAAYLRRQDEACASWYNQAVKAQGYAGTIEDAVRDFDDLWDYERRLQPWAQTFGKAALVLRDYAAVAEGDVRRDFLRLIGLQPDDFPLPVGRVNERINRDILEFQRLINRLPLKPQERRAFHKELITLTGAAAGLGIFGDAPLLSGRRLDAIAARYAPGNARVAREYLGVEHLFAARSPDRGQDGALDRTQGEDGQAVALTPEKLACILAWIMARQGGTND